MPEISIRGKNMPASSIRKLVPYAEEAAQKGRVVYKLNIGQPDIATSKNAIEAIKNFDKDIIEYAHSAGIESHRKKWTEYYKRINIDVNYEDILITTGGSEALLTGLMSCLDPGDELIIPEPFYANYWGFSFTLNIKVVPVTSTIESGFALPSIKEFEKVITPKTKAILLCNPNNPTGYLYSREELKQIKELVLKYNLFLFCDEVYREFVYDNHEHYSVMNLKGIDDHVVLVDSVSKRYSACGLRIGVLISRNKNITSSALKYLQSRLSSPSIGQIAGEAAIDTPSEYMEYALKEYTERRNFMVKRLNQMAGVYCPEPKGAFYTMTRLPVDDCDEFCKWLLKDFVHENQTVMLAPGTGFYSQTELGKHEVRIAYVINTEALKKALDCLEIALKQYPGKTN
jgi:aspartate aminotransferase